MMKIPYEPACGNCRANDSRSTPDGAGRRQGGPETSKQQDTCLAMTRITRRTR